MESGNSALSVHYHFPIGKGNRVRVVVDRRPTGGLDPRLEVESGSYAVAVTRWGLPLADRRRPPAASERGSNSN